jgi:hypothetical protein
MHLVRKHWITFSAQYWKEAKISMQPTLSYGIAHGLFDKISQYRITADEKRLNAMSGLQDITFYVYTVSAITPILASSKRWSS